MFYVIKMGWQEEGTTRRVDRALARALAGRHQFSLWLGSGEEVKFDFTVDRENIDVIASLRGAENTIYDLVDEPETLEERIGQIQDLYYKYYDLFYDAVKDPEGGNAYTVFQIWGPGRTVKLQCDFSAMMSPTDYRDLIQPAHM